MDDKIAISPVPAFTPIPQTLLGVVGTATLFAIMFDIGIAVVPGEWRWVSRQWPLLGRGLVSTLLVPPLLALLVAHIIEVPWPVEIGIVLMAISPGAPVALRRAFRAGRVLRSGERAAFAPALQILVAALAIVSMPLWIAALDAYYGGHATVAPDAVAKQVLVAQLLPLAAGILMRRYLPRQAERLERRLGRLAGLLLLAFTLLALIDIWREVVNAGPLAALAIALVCGMALAVGHALGGPDPATRSAVAISTTARNAGLALLVATANQAAPEVVATVLAYLVVSALAIMPYVAWCRRFATVPEPAL